MKYFDFSKQKRMTRKERARIAKKKKWYRSTYLNLLFLPLLFFLCLGVKDMTANMTRPAVAQQIISPLPKTAPAVVRTTERIAHNVITSIPVPTSTPVPLPTQQQQIKNYISSVFGASAPKAYKLLSCENSTYSPDRVNTAGNYPAGSRDIGVFQINEFWQGVNAKFLFNWRVNIDIAKQIYDESGDSFKMWTCGRRFGI